MAAPNVPISKKIGSQGFTLLEVITAMAVMGIVLTALFRLQSSTVTLSQAARFRQKAPALARQQLAALEQNGFRPQNLPEDIGGSGFTWSCDMAEDGSGADWEGILSGRTAKGLRKIRVTIFSPARDRSFSLVAWRYVHED